MFAEITIGSPRNYLFSLSKLNKVDASVAKIIYARSTTKALIGRSYQLFFRGWIREGGPVWQPVFFFLDFFFP